MDLSYSFQIVLFCNRQGGKCSIGVQSWKFKPEGLTATRWDFLPPCKTSSHKGIHFLHTNLMLQVHN